MTEILRHALIACHPAEDSFVISMARRYEQAVQSHGHEVVFRDLYRCGFDPVLRDEERTGRPAADVEAELELLDGCDVFVLVFPIWFGTMPAMLKGYIDRLFGAGRTLGTAGADPHRGLLGGKRLVSLFSSGAMRAYLGERGVLMALRNHFDRYLVEVFGLAGAENYHFDGVAPGMHEWEARAHLKEVEASAHRVMSRSVPRTVPRPS